MEENRFKDLLERYLRDELSGEEVRELREAVLDDRHAGLLDSLLAEAFTDPSAAADDGAARENVFSEVMAHIRAAETMPRIKTPVKARLGRRYRWLAGVAAVLLLAAGLGLYVYIRPAKTPNDTAQWAKQDLGPGSNKAVLTLADGEQIDLAAARNGKLAVQGSSVIDKTADGKIAYTAKGAAAGAGKTQFNSMTTPRGGQGEITLPDGTLAQLNAASSIRYPTAFNGPDRRVEITGEVYFEVAHNAAKPFRASSGGQVVEVLGTHFNINAYPDEPVTRTTLLEGSVKVTVPGAVAPLERDGLRLIPGEQARLSSGTLRVAEVKTEDAVAWKNGYFMFNNETLETALRKIARWYDVEVAYTDPSLKQMNAYGTLSRFSRVSKVLGLLELSGEVKFRIEGRKIIVSKNKP